MAYRVKVTGATFHGPGNSPARVYTEGDVISEDSIAPTYGDVLGDEDSPIHSLIERVDDSELGTQETQQDGPAGEDGEEAGADANAGAGVEAPGEPETVEPDGERGDGDEEELVVDPEEHTVEEVVAALQDATPDQVEAVKAAERRQRGTNARQGIVKYEAE